MEKENQNQSASFFKELGVFMKPYQGLYAVSVILSICSVACGIGSFAFAGLIAGALFEPEILWSKIMMYVAGVVLCKIFNTLLLNFSTWMSHKAAYGTLRDIRNAISDKLLRMPQGYFEENGSGRLKTMIADHIEGMEKTLAHMLPELTADYLGPLVCIVWMFFIDWRLALIALIWIILGFSVTGGMMKGYEEKYAGQIAALKGMNQSVSEYVSGIEVIKNFGRADDVYKKYKDSAYGYASYNVNWQKETQVWSALGMAIAPFSVFPVMIAGLIFFANHTLDAGTLFLMILLSFGIFGPLMNSMNYFDQMAGMGTNAAEIRKVLDYPELKRGTGATAENADIEFDNVRFRYSSQKEDALKGISLHVPQGSMLALVGPSGSGKSTIAKLLAGYWDYTEGEIRIGSHPLSDYTQQQLNQMIAYVDQDTFLFDESIADNIRLARPEATDEEVIQAAKRAGCDEFIQALPNGYKTKAGEAGGQLSGGERQRIAIARAMMKEADIMILDEATASSDPENEASIQQALTEAARGKTLVVIAHRLQTIVNADQIAFIKDGKVSMTGTHEQLMAHCQQYQDMYSLVEGN